MHLRVPVCGTLQLRTPAHPLRIANEVELTTRCVFARKGMARHVVLGVDGGTESIRAVFFDVQTGEVLSFAAEPYATNYPQPGWCVAS